jgi:hypothetical protein
MIWWSHGIEGFTFLALRYIRVAVLPDVQWSPPSTTYLPLENSPVLPAMAVISIAQFVSVTIDLLSGGSTTRIGNIATTML